jgi:acyl-CoA dehydrogenase
MVTTYSTDQVDIEEVTSGLARFIDSVIIPLEDENAELLEDHRGAFYDDRGGYSPAVVELVRRSRMESAKAGYYAMFCPIEVGGGGLGRRPQLLTYEFLTRRYGPARMLPYETIAHWAFGPSFLCSHFTPGLRSRLLDDIVSGRAGMCFGMSEPDAGSDAWMISTRAIRDGDEWVINGTKQWTTNGPHADYCYLFAVTDPDLVRQRKGGVSCFVVPMDAPGAAVDSVIKIFGDVGGNEAILSFTDVRVPADHLVGEEGQGFKLAMGGVSLGRVYNSGRALGYSQWALRQATEYAKSRKTFGKAIAEHEGVSFKLADSAMEIYAARHAAIDLTERLDRGELAIKELAMTKAFCCETMLRVADRAMQVCGGMGITNETNLHRIWHMARALQLADGSGEILRVTIAARLLRGELDF